MSERNGHSYKPQLQDIVWANYVLSIIRHNGILGYPDTKLSYRVNLNRRTLTLLNPEVLSDDAAKITHDRTKVVFRAIGYRVVTKK